MTKKDIILKVADETNLKQTDVKQVVQKTFDYMVEALVRGEKIELRNFGRIQGQRTKKPHRKKSPHRPGCSCSSQKSCCL